jgi:hypothetical protein
LHSEKLRVIRGSIQKTRNVKIHTQFVHERARLLSPHARIRESFAEGTLGLGRSVAAANLEAAAERCAPIRWIESSGCCNPDDKKELRCQCRCRFVEKI